MLSFPHHTFASDEPAGTVEFIDAETAKATAEPTPSDIGDVPMLLRQAGVGEIILIHGTFAGNDIVGIARQIARFAPGLGGRLSQLGKRWFDELIGEVGNYAESFQKCLSSLINPPSLDPIPISRFHWSGENHQLGRAEGAMSLLDSRLSCAAAARGREENGRLLIFAHSHGGNVIAMLSQLLGADAEAKQQFFEATRLHYRNPVTGKTDLPTWQQIKERLRDEPLLPKIDVATFGTPLRYRWNTDVVGNVLHFVQHRSLVPEDPLRAALPSSIQDVIGAAGGDYAQQLGIAGTDFPPSIFSWRDWIVERRLQRMFEPRVRRRDLIKHLKQGRRASCDGTTLLVDYGPSAGGWNCKLLGHGVYTCRQWLPFHLQQIATRFYANADPLTALSNSQR